MLGSSGCISQGLDEQACGPGGLCLNTSGGWICECSDPEWTNLGELASDPSVGCIYNRSGELAALACLVVAWVVVLLFAGSTAIRMYSYIQHSSRKRAEVALLSMKCFHASLFIVAGSLAMRSPRKAIGVDFSTTLVYALASSFFWIEYKLFLVVSTLSSVTAIARVIAPYPMRVYTMISPALVLCACFVSFAVLFMVNRDSGLSPSAHIIGTLHVGLSGAMGALLVGSHVFTMTIILNKFKEMQVSQTNKQSRSGEAPGTTKGSEEGGGGSIGGTNSGVQSTQWQKLGSVEGKIRQLRNETLILFVTLPPALVIASAVPIIRLYTPYLQPLGWTFAAMATCRFIYMSHATVEIHLRRLRTNITTNDMRLQSAASPADEKDSPRMVDGNRLGGEDGNNAKSVISSLALKRKRRRQKFINMMTRVEEERTVAMTKVEERFTVMDTNDISNNSERV